MPPTTITGPLSLGSRGPDVTTLQSLLNVKADGIFGIHTDEAVRAFQKSKGLQTDGIVGLLTAQALGVAFIHKPQPLPKPHPPGTVPPASTATPAAVLANAIAKELKRINESLSSSLTIDSDEGAAVFNRARKLIKLGMNQGLVLLVSAMAPGVGADFVANQINAALQLMVGGLGSATGELAKGGQDPSHVIDVMNALIGRIARIVDVVRKTLEGHIDGGLRAGVRLLRDLLDPLAE